MKKENATKTRSGKKNKAIEVSPEDIRSRVGRTNEDGVLDFRDPATAKSLPELSEEAYRAYLKVAAAQLTDVSPDCALEAEKDIYKKLRNACARAAMLDGGSKEAQFFRIISDPKYQEVVKQLGVGLMGIGIFDVIDTVLKKAKDGDTTCMRWALEITGFLMNKYEFHMNRVALKRTDVNVGGDVNFEGKSNEELKRLVASFGDD